jgi:hypothetical protein
MVEAGPGASPDLGLVPAGQRDEHGIATRRICAQATRHPKPSIRACRGRSSTVAGRIRRATPARTCRRARPRRSTRASAAAGRGSASSRLSSTTRRTPQRRDAARRCISRRGAQEVPAGAPACASGSVTRNSPPRPVPSPAPPRARRGARSAADQRQPDAEAVLVAARFAVDPGEGPNTRSGRCVALLSRTWTVTSRRAPPPRPRCGRRPACTSPRHSAG